MKKIMFVLMLVALHHRSVGCASIGQSHRELSLVPPFLSKISNFISEPSQAEAGCSSQNNPFLKTLVDHHVMLNPEPVRATNTCGDEWKTFGTCCLESSVLAFAKKDSQEFTEGNQRFTQQLADLVRAIFAASFKLNRRAGGPVRRQLRLFDLSSKRLSSPFAHIIEKIQEFKTINSKFDSERKEIAKHQSTCLDKLVELRMASFCSICSSRSSVFFRDNRALISMSTCRSIIGECHNYWASTIRVIQIISNVRKVIDLLKEIPVNDLQTRNIDFLMAWLKETNLEQSLQQCENSQTCSDEQASNICSFLIKIRAKENIASGGSLMVQDQTSVFQKISNLVDPLNQIPVPTADSSDGRRILKSPVIKLTEGEAPLLTMISHPEVSVVDTNTDKKGQVTINPSDMRFP